MPSPHRAPLITISPHTQAALLLAQHRPLSSVDVPTLRAQLNTLDTALSTLLNQRLAVSARLTEAVALSSPIRLLSSEILACIFIASTSPSDSLHDAPALLSTIMLVCKQWHDICLCTPDLWNRISISPTEPDSLEKAGRRLSRSKAVPLDIFLDFSLRSSSSAQVKSSGSHSHPHMHTMMPDHLLKTALLLLRPTISRWRTFVLLIPYRPQATAALALCSSPALMLESLTVHVSNPMLHVSTLEWDTGCKPILPFAGVTPRLRECSLTSFWCERSEGLTQTPQLSSTGGGITGTPPECHLLGHRPDSLIIPAVDGSRQRMIFPGIGPTLTKLRLAGFWNEFAPDLEEMMSVLRQCPLLEELSLRNITDLDPAEIELSTPVSTPVLLSRLRHVSFYYSGVTRTCALFHGIFLPALERLELSFLDNITGCLKHLKQQVLPHPAWSSYGYQYDNGYGCAPLEPQRHKGMAHFPLKSLRIEASLFNELKLMRLLRRLPALEQLELIDVEDVSSNLLRSLSIPIQPNEWILPRLEMLNLEGCTSVEWDALKALVWSRLPSSSASSCAAAALRHRGSVLLPSHGLSRNTTAVSSASEYARVQAMVETPYASTPLTLTPWESSTSAPPKITKLDLTRCSQISPERIQWLRMYVPNVVFEGRKGDWTGVDGV